MLTLVFLHSTDTEFADFTSDASPKSSFVIVKHARLQLINLPNEKGRDGKHRDGWLRDHTGSSGRTKTRQPFRQADPSSPFIPINAVEGQRYPRQTGVPVKPIPVRELGVSPQCDDVRASPQRRDDDDDGGFKSAQRTRRSLFTPRGGADEPTDARSRSLDSRASAPRETWHSSLLHSTPYPRHGTVPDFSPQVQRSPFRDERAFRRIGNAHPLTAEKTFYEHRPHRYWSPERRSQWVEEQGGRPQTRAVDQTHPHLQTLSKSKRSRTTGDLTSETNVQPFEGRSSLQRSSRSSTFDSRKQSHSHSPVLLRRKAKNSVNRERPQSMPNDVLLQIQTDPLFTPLGTRGSHDFYDLEDAPMTRPEKKFDLFNKNTVRSEPGRRMLSPQPARTGVPGRGVPGRGSSLQNIQVWFHCRIHSVLRRLLVQKLSVTTRVHTMVEFTIVSKDPGTRKESFCLVYETWVKLVRMSECGNSLLRSSLERSKSLPSAFYALQRYAYRSFVRTVV